MQRAIAASAKDGLAIEALRERVREMTRFANHEVAFVVAEVHPVLQQGLLDGSSALREDRRYA